MGDRWHFAHSTLKSMEKLTPVLAGKEEVFLSLAECAVFRSKRKLYVIRLLTGWCVAFLCSDAGCYLQVLSLSLPHLPPQPKPGGQPTGMSFGKQQQCFPCGSCFQLSPLIPMSHDLQCTEQIDVRHTHSNSLDSQKKKKRKRGWEWGGRFPCFSPALLIPAGACLPWAWFMAVTKKQCLPSSSVLSMRSSWIKGKAPVEAPAVSSAFSTAPPNETSPRQQSRASVFYVSPGW